MVSVLIFTGSVRGWVCCRWAGRVSPVVFVFKGTLAYLSYAGAGNAGYIKMRNSVYFQIGWKIRYLTNEKKLYSSINSKYFIQMSQNILIPKSQEIHSMDNNLLPVPRNYSLWQEICNEKVLLIKVYVAGLKKCQSMHSYINISCDFLILCWKILPTFPPWCLSIDCPAQPLHPESSCVSSRQFGADEWESVWKDLLLNKVIQTFNLWFR